MATGANLARPASLPSTKKARRNTQESYQQSLESETRCVSTSNYSTINLARPTKKIQGSSRATKSAESQKVKYGGDGVGQ